MVHLGCIMWSFLPTTYPASIGRATRLPNLRQTFCSPGGGMSFHWFSTFSCLLTVISLVFKFISKLWRQEENCDRRATLYLMKTTMSGICQGAWIPPGWSWEVNALPRLCSWPFPGPGGGGGGGGLICSFGLISSSSHFGCTVKNPFSRERTTSVLSWTAILAILICGCLDSGPLGTQWLLASSEKTGSQKGSSIMYQCRFNTRPMLPPNVASLPVSCGEFEIPFRNTGVNFTGHVWVKEGTTERKMYWLLFTCLSVRVVHIEVVPDMSVSSFFLGPVWYPQCSLQQSKTFLGSRRLFCSLSLLQEYQDKFDSCNVKQDMLHVFFSGWGECGKEAFKHWKHASTKLLVEAKQIISPFWQSSLTLRG